MPGKCQRKQMSKKPKLSKGKVRTPYWAFSESVSWFQLSVSACGTSSVECIVSASSRRSRTNAQNPAMLPRTLADQEFCNDGVVFACSEVDRYIIFTDTITRVQTYRNSLGQVKLQTIILS